WANWHGTGSWAQDVFSWRPGDATARLIAARPDNAHLMTADAGEVVGISSSTGNAYETAFTVWSRGPDGTSRELPIVSVDLVAPPSLTAGEGYLLVTLVYVDYSPSIFIAIRADGAMRRFRGERHQGVFAAIADGALYYVEDTFVGATTLRVRKLDL